VRMTSLQFAQSRADDGDTTQAEGLIEEEIVACGIDSGRAFVSGKAGRMDDCGIGERQFTLSQTWQIR
jgi:hypothetical protein